MKKIVYLNIGTFIGLLVAFVLAYYFLIQDNFLHISISSIIANSQHLENKRRLLVQGLLPVYIYMMIFGAAMLSAYLGSTLQHFFIRAIKKYS